MSRTIFLSLVLSPLFAYPYNVDTRHPVIYTDPGSGESNYFGYTVSLSPRKSPHPASLLVGAPRTFDGAGNVYRCTDIGSKTRPKSTCNGLKIDPVTSPKTVLFSDGTYIIKTETIGGLGISLATEDSSNFTVCAPRSVVTPYYPGFLTPDDMRGYCYNGQDDTLYRDNDILTSKKRYRINLDINSLYGFSVHYAVKKGQNSIERIVGQPGNNKVEIKHENKTRSRILSTENLSGYMGFSVSSGYFFESKRLLYVAGAPGWSRTGGVMVYDSRFKTGREIHGSVLGEYFGASLAVGDFDGDGLDDLAVGAPHWGEVDFGRVYTYYGSRNQNFNEGIMLQGAVRNGQFGYALASGDLDGDGFSDLVVSAPWEKSGVVYVFYGHSDFRVRDSLAQIVQRIEPSQFVGQPQIQRFGFSLSNSVDIDENGYPDLAIGAYKSGHAIVLRSKPVMATAVSLASYPAALTKSTQSFVVSVCVEYRGDRVPETQELEFKMTVDAKYKRVASGSWNDFTDVFPRGRSSCANQTISLLNGVLNFVDPIVVNVRHEIRSRDTDEFCSSCPVLSRNSPRESALVVPFSTGCRGGVVCNANLSVDARFGGKGDDKWVVGSGDTNLILIVRNDGEPAYLTELIVDIPPGIRLRNAVPYCRETLKENTVSLLCDMGNPLGTEEQKRLDIALNMEHVAESTENTMMYFNISRRTRSVDHGTYNPTILGLATENVAHLTLSGVTDNESLDYGRTEDESKVLIRHTYQVVKFGPSPVTEACLTIDVPASTIGRNDSFLNISDPKLTDSSGKTYNCFVGGLGVESEQPDGSQESSMDTLLLRKRRGIPGDGENIGAIIGPSTTEDGSEVYDDELEISSTNASGMGTPMIEMTDRIIYLNCSTEGISCARITCRFSIDKSSGNLGNLALNMIFDAGAFYTSKEKSRTIKMNTNASVDILWPQISDTSFVQNTSAEVATILFNIPEPQKLALWVLPSSIVCGILLFFVLTVILCKVGFFNRVKKLDIAKAKEEMKMKSIGTKNDNDSSDLTQTYFVT